jgi:hypothetical protein
MSHLTGAQKAAIIERFANSNPHWRGAHADDILDVLDQSDANLDQVEPFYEQHPELPDGSGTAIRALIWSGQPVTLENVLRLLGLWCEP